MTSRSSPKPAHLRPYPWPYRAALAFSNDCDFTTLPAMLGLHHLFAASQSEGGLDLELSDSFFFYSHGTYPTYSYFNGLSQARSEAAPVIRELVAAGYIDTTHALGDFEHGGFTRALAEHALAEFQRHGLTLPVWSNHGGAKNVQNIGSKDFAFHHGGDNQRSPSYVLDIAEDLGGKYFWRDGMRTRRMALKPSGNLVTEIERQAPRNIVLASGREAEIVRRARSPFDRYEVFETFETRAGAKLQGFVRFNPFLPGSDAAIDPANLLTPKGIRPGPNVGRLADELTPRLLDALIAAQGCAFLYQHLSTLAHVPERLHMSEKIEFHPANLEALRLLKSYETRGQIWVAAQAILLDYLYALNTLEVAISHEADTATVAAVPRSGFALREVSGLTVQLDTPAQRAVFVLPGGRTLPATIVGPDEEGKSWAQLPVKRLPAISWREIAKLARIELPAVPRVTLLDGSKPVSLVWPGLASG